MAQSAPGNKGREKKKLYLENDRRGQFRPQKDKGKRESKEWYLPQDREIELTQALEDDRCGNAIIEGWAKMNT